MGVPTLAHFVYIPVVILIGVMIGWVLGGRAARDHYEVEKQKAAERAERKAARAARAAEAAGGANPIAGTNVEPPAGEGAGPR
jgi:hypothetical protein